MVVRPDRSEVERKASSAESMMLGTPSSRRGELPCSVDSSSEASSPQAGKMKKIARIAQAATEMGRGPPGPWNFRAPEAGRAELRDTSI